MSLDGFLATKDDDLSWLSIVEKEGEDYGYTPFTQSVGAYIVGRRTYEKVLEMTGGDFPPAEQYDCYVLTSTPRSAEKGVQFYTGDLTTLVEQLKQKGKKNIYCDGGGIVVQSLMKEHLIDEYIISVIPTILGDGKRLFLGDTPPIDIELVDTKSYSTGLVQLHYKQQ